MSLHRRAIFRRFLPTPGYRSLAMRSVIAASLLCSSTLTVAADDLTVAQLEQDVRELQRQVQMLSRQIDAQRMQAALPGSGSTQRSSTPVIGVTPAWIDAARWQKLTTGMSELEVIATLGPPTSMRTEEGQRVLLYALEIGSSGFLSGSVTLRDRAVVRIQKPALQ